MHKLFGALFATEGHNSTGGAEYEASDLIDLEDEDKVDPEDKRWVPDNQLELRLADIISMRAVNSEKYQAMVSQIQDYSKGIGDPVTKEGSYPDLTKADFKELLRRIHDWEHEQELLVEHSEAA